MKRNYRIYALVAAIIFNVVSYSGRAQQKQTYLNNRAPLTANPYVLLPLGAVKPAGWLKEQLMRMKTGLTGNLDIYYSSVAGKRNAWLGGDGDAWERGPYWIDGLLPLAYLLDDKQLIAKVKPWVEWTLMHQRADGYIGPDTTSIRPKEEEGLQKDNREDWWPRMVMLKILQQHYEATSDQRVIPVLTKYFRYQLNTLPSKPLDNWTFWGNQRGADNLMVVYWLYNITGEKFLLDLGNLIYDQTFPFTKVFLNPYQGNLTDRSHLFPYNTGNKYPYDTSLINKLHVGQFQSFHCVNIAQGLKTPVIYYQQSHDKQLLKAAKTGLNDLTSYHGQAQGMYGGDEPIHGNAPTQGVEFCSVVELMFSLESMLAVTGDLDYADRLEKLAYNALPTQASDDFMYRQYFQSANQVEITRQPRNFIEDASHRNTDACYGFFTGYTCCTANMHQGWPKFTRNLFYAAPGNGLAALVYGPAEVTALVADGQPVTIREETNYPFDETIRFSFQSKKPVKFPFHLRIPSWAKGATVKINGIVTDVPVKSGSIVIIEREWKAGDVAELQLPMEVRSSRWAEASVAVERGPLVYALKMQENWKKIDSTDEYSFYYEVTSPSPWNYGMVNNSLRNPQQGFEVIKQDNGGKYPWNAADVPVMLKTKAKKIPWWIIYNHMSGPVPTPFSRPGTEGENIILIPYGSTTLRIAQFPVVD
ncbi:MAG: hypothetical protein EOO05_03405 [Chitinophagaceae bacterium]|nr:MAG: hypothetical protein EOO05_03405 [Chitinophagaceae bacterium]